jgi:hypothetical protein
MFRVNVLVMDFPALLLPEDNGHLTPAVPTAYNIAMQPLMDDNQLLAGHTRGRITTRRPYLLVGGGPDVPRPLAGVGEYNAVGTDPKAQHNTQLHTA